MISNQNTHSTCSNAGSKRQRTYDPSDSPDIEPPTKVSKTSSGPRRYHIGDGQETQNHEVEPVLELEEQLKGTLRTKNAIACCPPSAVARIFTNILSWIVHEAQTDFSGSVTVIVVADVSTMQQLREDVYRNFPALSTYAATGNENDMTSFNMPEKGAIFMSVQALAQLLPRNVLPLMQISAILFYCPMLFGTRSQPDAIIERVMLDSALRSAPMARPRILVLSTTLQPISPGSAVHQFAKSLNASLLGFSGSEVTSGSQSLSMELVVTYLRQEVLQETLLCKKLRDCDPEGRYLGRHFRRAKLALGELGPCAADLVWREACAALSEDQGLRAPLSRAQELVKHWPFKLPNLDLSSRNMNVTHKFMRFAQILESFRSFGDSFRGIVFVEKRAIAQLLVALIHGLMPHLQFLRPVALLNHNRSSDYTLPENSFYRQYASGQFNLLVTTKSYEDVALPQASVVILFDVFESQLFHAYARSCIKDKGGHLIHMIEEGNNAHRHALAKASFDSDMLRWCNNVRHDSLCIIPPKPLYESNDAYISDSEDDQDVDFIQDPVSGHRLEKHQATRALFCYVDRLARSSRISRNEDFLKYVVFESSGDPEWHCVVRLPGTPIDRLSGPRCHSRALARREACYSACRQLQHLGELTSPFFPRPHPLNQPSSQDGGAEVLINPNHERPHIPLSPDFWRISVSRPPLPDFLYPWIVSTAAVGSGLDERAPICILTRIPLPDLPNFQLFHLNKPLQLRFHRAPPVKLESNQFEQTHRFTVKFCRIVMNKPFESSSWRDMGYLFLPMKRTWKPPPGPDQQSSPLPFISGVDWDTVTLVSETWAVPLVNLVHLEHDLEDAVVQDRAVEFTHRCEISRVRSDMTPLSEVDDKPAGYSLLKYAAFSADGRFENGGKTLLEQCHSRRKTFSGLLEPNQPILEVTRMAGATNCLNPRIPSSADIPDKAVQLLIPEYSRKLTVPASTLRMGYLLPSVTRRIDELLLVKQLNAKILGRCVRDDLLVIATASPLAGNEYDYERLELLGDAFLKYLSSIYVYAQSPQGSEGELHTARQKYISNQQLCDITSHLGLPGYIQVKPFNLKSWLPHGMRLGDPQKESTSVKPTQPSSNTLYEQSSKPSKPLMDPDTANRSTNRKKRPKNSPLLSPIANKTVADVAEAIIGAACISGGRDAGLKAAKALMIPFTGIEEWCDLDRDDCIPQPSTGRHLETSAVNAIEGIIGHALQKKHLLTLALIHSTFNTAEMKNHQRLEFIGDAILDFLVVRHLFDRNPHASPGDLSVLKSMMVSNSTLAAICVWSRLHKFIHGTQQLGQIIHKYERALLDQQTAMLSMAHGESKSMTQYWKDLEAPKALSDVVESIIGAALVSDGFSQAGVDAIFGTLLLPFYEKYLPLRTAQGASE